MLILSSIDYFKDKLDTFRDEILSELYKQSEIEAELLEELEHTTQSLEEWIDSELSGTSYYQSAKDSLLPAKNIIKKARGS